MDAAASPSHADQVADQLLSKLKAIESGEAAKRRWYWLSWLVRAFILLQLLQLALFVAGITFVVGVRTLSAVPTQPPPIGALDVALSAAGWAIQMLISVWALRYATARADGRL